MKNLLPILFLGLMACEQKATEPVSQAASSATYTKTMVYAVDLNSIFHEDLNDEDFSDVLPLTKQLIADVLDGKRKAYDPVSDKVFSAAEINAKLIFTDTVWFEEPETGDRSIRIFERDYTAEFYGLTFKEQWSYNKEAVILEKKIVAVAPRIPVYSSLGGELRGYTSAFWVKYP